MNNATVVEIQTQTEKYFNEEAFERLERIEESLSFALKELRQVGVLRTGFNDSLCLSTFLETSATICPSRILMIRNERWTMQSQMYRLRTCHVTSAANIFNDNNKLIIIYCPYVVSIRYNLSLSLQGSQSQAGRLWWSGISQSWGLCRLPPASTRSVAPLQQSDGQWQSGIVASRASQSRRRPSP